MVRFGSNVALQLSLTIMHNIGAPECFRRDAFDDSREIRITQSVDIYSLGCVLSEVCIWTMFGKAILEEYRQSRRSHNAHIARGADYFHVGGLKSAAVERQHDKALRSPRCDPITANILMLLPDIMMADPARRPHAWMLRVVFSELMPMSGSSRPSNWATETLHKLMSSEQTSLSHQDGRLNLQDSKSEDTTAPAKVVRGVRIQFSDQGDTLAADSVTLDRTQAPHPNAQAGASHAPDTVSLDHHQREMTPISVDTPTAVRRRKGPSTQDTAPSSSASLATSIYRPFRQAIPHYRLTPAIIGRELQKIFPDYDIVAFKIRVDTCSFLRVSVSYHTNVELGE
jgi:hypothetical protein